MKCYKILSYSRKLVNGKWQTFRHESDICNAICVSRRDSNEIYVMEKEPQIIYEEPLQVDGWHNKACEVLSPDGLATCIHTQSNNLLQKVKYNNRIRKLTPRECFRLMGLRDVDIDKIQAVGISNTQQYKLAGNSIVVDNLAAIFNQLFGENKEKPRQQTIF